MPTWRSRSGSESTHSGSSPRSPESSIGSLSEEPPHSRHHEEKAGVLLSGWLEKRPLVCRKQTSTSVTPKLWRRRWVVLTEDALQWSARARGQPSGELLLTIKGGQLLRAQDAAAGCLTVIGMHGAVLMLRGDGVPAAGARKHELRRL